MEQETKLECCTVLVLSLPSSLNAEHFPLLNLPLKPSEEGIPHHGGPSLKRSDSPGCIACPWGTPQDWWGDNTRLGKGHSIHADPDLGDRRSVKVTLLQRQLTPPSIGAWCSGCWSQWQSFPGTGSGSWRALRFTCKESFRGASWSSITKSLALLKICFVKSNQNRTWTIAFQKDWRWPGKSVWLMKRIESIFRHKSWSLYSVFT